VGTYLLTLLLEKELNNEERATIGKTFMKRGKLLGKLEQKSEI